MSASGDRVIARLSSTEVASERDLPPTINVVRGTEVKMRVVEWLWRGRIPYGKITIADGDPGQGKSTVALDVAARLTSGRPMPDGSMPQRGVGTVLIISAEDTIEDTIAPRLVVAGADMAKVLFFKLQRDDEGSVMPLVIPDHLRAIGNTINQHGVAFVILDPFVAYLSERIQAHNDASIRQAMSPLTLMAEETGAAVFCIRHLNKGTGMSAIHRGGGSVGIGGAARSVLVFAQHPDAEVLKGLYVMAQAKGNLAARAPSLGYRITGELLPIPEMGRTVELPIVVWERLPVPLTADQLVSPGGGRADAPERDAAANWLAEVLSTGPVAVADLKDDAGDAGMGWRTVERAKAVLGVKSERRHLEGRISGYVWRLPGEEHALKEGVQR